MLGHRPDEFGLVPDIEGFIPYKDLLQAIHEEEGWRYVRRSHINEVLLGKDRSLFESADEGIRSVERRWELDPHTPAQVPKILFTAVRRKAHPVVREMALRIGRRRDQNPVALEILADAAREKRIFFYSFGDLFLSPEIQSRFIAGPPVPKEMLERKKEKDKPTETTAKSLPTPTPGTFTLDPSRDPDRYRKAKGKKRKGWKENARKMRRNQKGRTGGSGDGRRSEGRSQKKPATRNSQLATHQTGLL